MTPSIAVVDIIETSQGLRVAWTEPPGTDRRSIDRQVMAHLDGLAAEVARAEHGGTPAALGVARGALGRALFELLDGPERALARRLEAARRGGGGLDVLVRLRLGDGLAVGDRARLATHPAARWRWELMAGPQGPLALERQVSIAVQLGERDPGGLRALGHGRLRLLFMAYSPEDVQPVLDFEHEEEAFLEALREFVQDGRLVLRVAEEGTLAELRRCLQRRAYDVVHLTGHGVLRAEGPRLVMEGEGGQAEEVSPKELLRAFEDGQAMPELVVISSCYSAAAHTDLPSLAAALVAGGVPAVVGWVRPVRDDVATEAASELYQRLCLGDGVARALTKTRRRLDEADHERPQPVAAWGTLQLLVRETPGFWLNPEAVRDLEELPVGVVVYRYLGQSMRVLERGFVGRRRYLQRLVRLLRDGRVEGRPVAGAAVVGMKGAGKSCLVGRAIERHAQDVGEGGDLGLVVLHGELSEAAVLEAFREQALRWGDEAAVARLQDGNLPAWGRLERLLRGPEWSGRRLVIVLDDFEQNLTVPGEGLAELSPAAAALLEVLVPACRMGRPKLLITSTAVFALPERLGAALVTVELGALEVASVEKLWMRGLTHVPPGQWAALAERLGRNARVLDWARQLLGGKVPEEVEKLVKEAGELLPDWGGQVPDEDEQARLAAAFLRHMAYEEAKAKVSADALEFVRRARVYETPVPLAGLAGLVEGLAITLDRHVPALANLGLLEMGTEEGVAVYRVSPLVEPTFEAEEPERWHGVAAEYWQRAAKVKGGYRVAKIQAAWEHALASRRQDIADWAADGLSVWLDDQALHGRSYRMAERHLGVFPRSVAGLMWAGYAAFRAGDPRQGKEFLLRAEEVAVTAPQPAARLHRLRDAAARVLHACGDLASAKLRFEEIVRDDELSSTDETYGLALVLHELARILHAQGDHAGARVRLERALAIKHKILGTEDPQVAVSLGELASVLLAQGDHRGARARLERALAISFKFFGTEKHPDVASDLGKLAVVLRTQGDLTGARACLERSLAIKREVLGTEDHRDIAGSLHDLAVVLHAQGELAGARACIERCLAIELKIFGTDEHLYVAGSLYALAGVLKDQGDIVGACVQLERSLTIQQKILGTEEHLDVAASLHGLALLLKAKGDIAGARAQMERSLAILLKVLDTEEHPAIASSLGGLAGVLHAEGKLEEAVATFRRVLAIEEKVFGSLDQYHSADTEAYLGQILLQLGRPDEGLPHILHAMQVLSAQAPGHPELARLRALFGAQAKEP